jgi:hypothetical protein
VLTTRAAVSLAQTGACAHCSGVDPLRYRDGSSGLVLRRHSLGERQFLWKGLMSGPGGSRR